MLEFKKFYFTYSGKVSNQQRFLLIFGVWRCIKADFLFSGAAAGGRTAGVASGTQKF